ncbi:MAG: hypothetical protein U1F43_12265 [Myxococcota bacterium]
MCCFSGPVRWVGQTRIYARATDARRQLLVYGMSFDSAADVAMILPLPVARDGGPRVDDDALRFVDLSPWPGFFDDLALAFPAELARGGAPFLAPQAKRQTLAVHRVGDFEASYVPTVADFARLDARFRMPRAVWSALPAYADFGFAVFQLGATTAPSFWPWRRKAAPRTVHPMAFEFPRARPGEVFFPTLHVHDGRVRADAVVDHTLYLQAAAAPDGWVASSAALGALVAARVPGVLDAAAPAFKKDLGGRLPNRDVTLAV